MDKLKKALLTSFCLPLLYFLAVGIILAVSLPPYSTPDEQSHIYNASFIFSERRLPNIIRDNKGLFIEVHQPPLYYYLTAKGCGLLNVNCSRTYYLNENHQREVKTMRIFNILVGAACVVLIWLALKKFGGTPLAIFGTWFVVLIPKFSVIMASVNNDPLVIFFGAASTLLLIYWLKTKNIYYLPALGIALGLGLLTKITLAPLLIGSLLIVAVEEKTPKHAIQSAIYVATPTLLVTAPWLLYNYKTYGQLLTTSLEKNYLGSILPGLLVQNLKNKLFWYINIPPSLWRSFWFSAGSNQILVPDAYYLLVAPWFLAAVYGLKKGRFSNKRHTYLLSIPVIIAVITVIGFAFIYTQSQGRLLYPLITIVALLFYYGLRFVNMKMPFLFLVFLAVFSLVSYLQIWHYY